MSVSAPRPPMPPEDGPQSTGDAAALRGSASATSLGTVGWEMEASHAPPKYDVFGQELPPGKGSGLRDVMAARSPIRGAETRSDWNHAPAHRTRSELLGERRAQMRQAYHPPDLAPGMVERLRKSSVFAKDLPAAKAAYERRGAAWEEEPVAAPVESPRLRTRGELLESRRQEDLDMAETFRAPERDVDPQAAVAHQRWLATQRAGFVAKPAHATQSQIKHERRVRARSEAGLLPEASPYVASGPAGDPKGGRVQQPVVWTQSQLRRQRRVEALDAGARVDAVMTSAQLAVLAEQARKREALFAVGGGTASEGAGAAGVADAAPPAARLRKPPRPWAGETGVSPLAHMRTMAADAARTLGLTRTALLRERSARFAEEARRFQPTRPAGVHPDEAPSFEALDAPRGRGWWERSRELRAEHAARAAAEDERYLVPAQQVTGPPGPGRRPAGERSRLLAAREAAGRAEPTPDPGKVRAERTPDAEAQRVRREGLAPKVTQVPESLLVAGAPERPMLAEDSQRRWTDVVIDFHESRSEQQARQVDEKGKLKVFTPGELDPLFSSFTPDGRFRDPWAADGGRLSSAHQPVPQAGPEPLVGLWRSPALRGAGRTALAGRTRSQAGRRGKSKPLRPMTSAGDVGEARSGTVAALRRPVSVHSATHAQGGGAEPGAAFPQYAARGGAGQPPLILRFGEGAAGTGAGMGTGMGTGTGSGSSDGGGDALGPVTGGRRTPAEGAQGGRMTDTTAVEMAVAADTFGGTGADLVRTGGFQFALEARG